MPRQIGPVKLIREIGRGGMGVVWLGRHELLRTDVAVKFILVHDIDPHADAMERERFLDGARTAASIRHPGLTRILHADIINSIPYLVMEYIPSRTIAELHERHRCSFSVDAALSILDAVAEIIAHLHQHDVVHGDIKPTNLLLDQSGHLFVTDFGLACRPGDPQPMIAGTPASMAPEMFEGTINPRTDVYALGIMAYELLAGRLPFLDENRNALRLSHATLPFPYSPLRRREVPKPVIAFIERATNRNPLYRIKSAGQLLNILRMELSAFYRPLKVRDALLAHLRRAGQPAISDAETMTAGKPNDPGHAAPVRRIASLKREERAGASRPARKKSPDWFLTSTVFAAPRIELATVYGLCIRCGRMSMTVPNERHCANCGGSVQAVPCGTRPGNRPRRSEQTAARRTLSRWLDVLRMPRKPA